MLLIRSLILCCALGLLACQQNNANFVVGVWTSKTGDGVRLILEEGGSFQVYHIPATFVCNTASVVLISGNGRWMYDAADGRIVLAFDDYSNRDICVAPYGASAFFVNMYGHSEVVFGVLGEDDNFARLVRG